MRRFVLFLFLGSWLSACSCEGDGALPQGDGGVDGALPDGSTLPDGALPDATSAGCGDSVVGSGESCDDGNAIAFDGCGATCQLENGWTCPTPGVACRFCGDGTLQAGEVCDDGNATSGDGCTAACDAVEPGGYRCIDPGEPCERCGDAVVDLHETCDDGDFDGGDGCSSTCQLEAGYHCEIVGQACFRCGDTTVDPFETCDDGANTAGDGCSATCQVEPGWDCGSGGCSAAACGDGLRAGSEQCDDGARVSGDGCSYRCTIEPGWVCITEGIPCRASVCGDSAVEAQETCDDGNTNAGDGCSASCRVELGYACATPGSPCTATSCGNGIVEGIEACDDGDATGGDGCSASCALEAGYECPTPGVACVVTTCADGQVRGTEACDDGNAAAGDGCSPTCTVEPFFECTGSPSSCRKPVEFVRIASFAAPMAQPQAVHYDPETQSFVAYGYNQSQGWQEVCLDGTLVPNATRTRPRASIGNALDGAAYDPFHDRFLFVRQNGELTEIDRTGTVVRQVTLAGVGVAGGVQVGDDGRLYVANHYAEKIVIFERFATTQVGEIATPTDGPYLDNIFMIPGQGWVGYYNLAPGQTVQQFTFHTYDGALVGRSFVPGALFANGVTFPANADGGEAAVDGGYFLVCSEYLSNSGSNNGICQLFSRRCSTDLECADRVPGTACNTGAAIPYCYAPARARDDFYQVGVGAVAVPLDVLANDQASQAVCLGGTPVVDSVVSPGSRGGTITVAPDGSEVVYTPGSSFCGQTETFEYTADLTGGTTDVALVTVFVACVCGNDLLEPGEQCDDGGNAAGDGCSPTCRFEPSCGNSRVDPGEQCDDGNVDPGDGCSTNCLFEIE